MDRRRFLKMAAGAAASIAGASSLGIAQTAQPQLDSTVFDGYEGQWLVDVANLNIGSWVQYYNTEWSRNPSYLNPQIQFLAAMGMSERLRDAGLDAVLNYYAQTDPTTLPFPLYNAYGQPVTSLVQQFIYSSDGHEQEVFNAINQVGGLDNWNNGVAGLYLALWEQQGVPSPVDGMTPKTFTLSEPISTPISDSNLGCVLSPDSCILTWPGFPPGESQSGIPADDNPPIGVVIPWYYPEDRWTPQPLKGLTKADLCFYLRILATYWSVATRAIMAGGALAAVFPEAGSVLWGITLGLNVTGWLFC